RKQSASSGCRRNRSTSSGLLTQDPRHAEPVLFRSRSTGQRLVTRKPRPHLVRPEHVGDRNRVRSRRDVVRGDLAHPGHRIQDYVELAGERVEFVLGDGQSRQFGEMRDLVAGDLGHYEGSLLMSGFTANPQSMSAGGPAPQGASTGTAGAHHFPPPPGPTTALPWTAVSPYPHRVCHNFLRSSPAPERPRSRVGC